MDKSAKEALQDVLKIQKNEPSIKYDPYMLGLLNGMLLAESFIEGNDYEPRKIEPQTLSKRIKRWWRDKTYKPVAIIE